MIHRFTEEDGYHEQIESLLGEATQSDEELVLLHFAAGKIYDDIRNYDLAFNHYQRANERRKADFDRAGYCGGYHEFMEHWREVLTVPILDVDYESLVSKPKACIRQMIEFIDLKWEPNLMEFNRTHRAVQTASKWQVRQPIYNHSVHRWRNYERHLQPLTSALRERGVPCGGE